METVAIVAAAGAGRRMGSVCKAVIEIDGRPLLSYSLEVLQNSGLIDGICIVVPPELLSSFQRESSIRWPFEKIFAWVAGGERRQDSVAAALSVVPDDVSLIAVHDAARPFITAELLQRLIAAARAKGAAIPAIRVVDTIKELAAPGVAGRSLDRENLLAVQTPQVFVAELLRRAYRNAEKTGGTVTDDAALVNLMGHEVAVVEGSRDNFKITVREDLEAAERMVRYKSQVPNPPPASGSTRIRRAGKSQKQRKQG